MDPNLVDALVDNDIPFLNVNGSTGHSNRQGPFPGLGQMVCQALIDQILAAGGDATQIQLPDFGLVGHSHMYFWENDSDQIAQIVIDWIGGHVK